MERMVESLGLCRRNYGAMEVILFLLIQNSNEEPDALTFPNLTIRCHVFQIENVISLSAARNILLEKVLSESLLDDDDLIAFPDDDCWYPSFSLPYVWELFTKERTLDVAFCRYGANPQLPTKPPKQPTVQELISYSCSITLFLRARVVKSLRNFDEALGLGAKYLGGEDTDFSIRAFLAARSSLYIDAQLIGHRDSDPKRKPMFFPGSFIAIAKHRGQSWSLRVAALRKFLIGCLHVASGKMPLRILVEAVRVSRARQHSLEEA